ncbi:dTDP-4-amino-4,6-dideoxygalactose transaminase [Chryseobacterium sp. H3056]|uniref:dTDP-4-amino-4,6-dideoxygalactose transaminase n=1 Tax=Kaistella daneshvariae TaxID=2487074 RepID=A0A3N0WVX3_9FLAO|nr:dTDP-4-amino-4,6-dideoxygalactose transaminase [Kaistella daneshvariae]ROI09227.1 dTDP-4-amino-4,6-dideoxygalactose transaminase [Kaistella daneshvariae]
MSNIPFNKTWFTGREIDYISESLQSGKTSGNGQFSKRCQEFFEKRYGFGKTLMTTSCTDALEMCALLLDVGPGDEVIIPSYTFVSTALPFVRQGATIVFADSGEHNPNIDADKIESLITGRTKAIVVVHYAGIACDMAKIMEIANRYGLIVIEDAAQAIDSYWFSEDGKKEALGSIGHLAAFSFHETKNIVSGEGGLLVVNDEKYFRRSEILWEKGTNRAEFFRGAVNKYGWVDTGSSFLASDITAAYLWAQLQQLEEIQQKRKALWETYDLEFKALEDIKVGLPEMPPYAMQNGHLYYVVAQSLEHRTEIIERLKKHGIGSAFHYLSLHKSEFYKDKYRGGDLHNADKFTDRLLRLPLFYEMTPEDVKNIVRLGGFNSK